MNLPYWIIGILAGLVSALLFFSAASGSTLASLIIYLTPLPLFIAGLGWGQLSVGIGALAGAAFLTGVAGLPTAGIFIAINGLLPYILCQRALLFRDMGISQIPGTGTNAVTGEPAHAPAIEWYPVGHLLILAAGVAGGLVVALDIALRVGGYAGGLEQAVTEMLQIFIIEPGTLTQTLREIGSPLSAEDVTQTVKQILPGASAIVWTLAMLGNMWLAELAVNRSAHAIRPIPAYSYFLLPRAFSYAYVVVVVLALITSPVSYVAGAVAAALTVPYFLLGLATIHVISRGWAGRSLFIGLFYALLLFVGWFAIPVSLLGILEPWLGLRARILQARQDRD